MQNSSFLLTRVSALDESGEVVLDHEAGRLATGGDPAAVGPVLGHDLADHLGHDADAPGGARAGVLLVDRHGVGDRRPRLHAIDPCAGGTASMGEDAQGLPAGNSPEGEGLETHGHQRGMQTEHSRAKQVRGAGALTAAEAVDASGCLVGFDGVSRRSLGATGQGTLLDVGPHLGDPGERAGGHRAGGQLVRRAGFGPFRMPWLMSRRA